MSIVKSSVTINTADGVVDSHVFYPAVGKPCPAVILYMDGLGIRPELLGMGERLAENGYVALVPNLFYRDGPAVPVDLQTIFNPGPANSRMMSQVMALTGAQVMSDTAAYLDFLEKDDLVLGLKVGTVGYCMGGSMSLRAAGHYPERVAAAASIHGARLATDQPDSPHLLAAKIRGQLYVGVAGIDPYLFEGESATLKQALEANNVTCQVEHYPEAIHGFALPGNPIYDKPASEQHWDRLLALFGKALQ